MLVRLQANAGTSEESLHGFAFVACEFLTSRAGMLGEYSEQHNKQLKRLPRSIGEHMPNGRKWPRAAVSENVGKPTVEKK